jgi:hypothetical protein
MAIFNNLLVYRRVCVAMNDPYRIWIERIGGQVGGVTV